VRELDARVAAVIRVDSVWLAVQPLDMRAGTEAALARVVTVFGEARPHHAYLFANRRANQTTFSIPIIVRGDRVPVAPAQRKQGSAVSTGR
jgi:hypothetical protein